MKTGGNFKIRKVFKYTITMPFLCTVWSSDLYTLLMRYGVKFTSYHIKSVYKSLDQTVYCLYSSKGCQQSRGQNEHNCSTSGEIHVIWNTRKRNIVLKLSKRSRLSWFDVNWRRLKFDPVYLLTLKCFDIKLTLHSADFN